MREPRNEIIALFFSTIAIHVCTDSWHKFPPVFSSVKQYYSEEEEEEEECLEKSNDQYLYPRDSPSLLWKSATSDIAPYTSARIFTPVENFR